MKQPTTSVHGGQNGMTWKVSKEYHNNKLSFKLSEELWFHGRTYFLSLVFAADLELCFSINEFLRTKVNQFVIYAGKLVTFVIFTKLPLAMQFAMFAYLNDEKIFWYNGLACRRLRVKL